MRKTILGTSISLLALIAGCAGEPTREEATAGSPGEPDAGTSGSSGEGAASSGGGEPRAGASAEGGRGNAGRGGASGDAGRGAGGSGLATEPESAGVEVDVEAPNQSVQAALETELSELDELDASGLRDRYPSEFASSLGYDPREALGLDTLQGSPLSLEEGELELLGEHGFVITDRQSFPSFVDGYAAIYSAHLPLYVSADSILNATHRSYDKILLTLEQAVLIPTLESLLERLRSALAAGAADEFGATAVADADVYLTVARSLLAGELLEPGTGGPPAQIDALYEHALEAEGWDGEPILLFGVARELDFSQFTPRGHYAGIPELENYFRAMIWLGMMDLRLIETLEDGSQVFRRRQLELAYALRALYDDTSLREHRAIDSVVRAFVGESDNMTLEQLDALLADLGAESPAALAERSDQELAQAILDGGYGAQQISGQILKNGSGGPIPLSSIFLLLGRRYVVDSHVFSNVVHGRVPYRMMPNPLDVAFAALANNQAGSLLESELTAHAYAPALAKTRKLVDDHPQSFWDANLYNGWLDALRALSPPEDLSDPSALGLPAVAATEAWGRRVLNTQLASWAELRHDTVLYAKQSYTDVPECEFPDGYVDPYPDFYAKIRAYAERGQVLVAELDFADEVFGAAVLAYFDNLAEVATELEGLAEHQQSGTPFSEAQVSFLNSAVSDSQGCFYDPDGWYPRLVFGGVGGANDTEFDPPITDVHTQPADEGGNPVGRVLHVATGLARLMVVTANTCTGARAYVGLASSYFERVTEDFERLKDEDWAEEVMAEAPEEVPWMQDLVAR
jgi:hypothetical protein